MYSIKRYIVSYISLKILKGEIQVNTKLPSENTLARKFNCSRLTARGSLVSLVNAGIVKVIKGSGYYVDQNAIVIIMIPKFIQNNSVNQRTKINHSYSDDNIILLTEYYDINNQLCGMVRWILSKGLYSDISSQYELELNICDYIIDSSIKGFSFSEWIDYDEELERNVVKRIYFDENRETIFKVDSWYKNFKVISSRTFEIN